MKQFQDTGKILHGTAITTIATVVAAATTAAESVCP
jgi:hypothetical protein